MGEGERSEPAGGDLMGEGERSEPVLVTRGRGHPSVRATHPKTVELTAERDLTARATCVVATMSADDLARLTGLRGRLVLTLRAGACSDRITAVANPRFVGGTRAVLRRSDHRSPETLATRADKAAADLDRNLIAALADPDTHVEVVVELGAAPVEQTAELLMIPWRFAAALVDGMPPAGASPAASTWAAAVRSASLVVGVGRGVAPARRLAATTGQRVEANAAGIALVRQELARGGAAALICEDTPTPSDVAALAAELARDGWTVRAVGVPATTAALVAAGLTGAPFADCGVPARTAVDRRRQIAALAAAGLVGVWRARGDAVADLLRDVAAVREAASAGLSVDIDGPDEVHRRGTPSELSAAADGLSGTETAVVVADLRGDAPSLLSDLPASDLLRALLDVGVPASTLARGLSRLPGMTRRDAYDLALSLKRERPQDHRGAAGS